MVPLQIVFFGSGLRILESLVRVMISLRDGFISWVLLVNVISELYSLGIVSLFATHEFWNYEK